MEPLFYLLCLYLALYWGVPLVDGWRESTRQQKRDLEEKRANRALREVDPDFALSLGVGPPEDQPAAVRIYDGECFVRVRGPILRHR